MKKFCIENVNEIIAFDFSFELISECWKVLWKVLIHLIYNVQLFNFDKLMEKKYITTKNKIFMYSHEFTGVFYNIDLFFPVQKL